MPMRPLSACMLVATVVLSACAFAETPRTAPAAAAPPVVPSTGSPDAAAPAAPAAPLAAAAVTPSPPAPVAAATPTAVPATAPAAASAPSAPAAPSLAASPAAPSSPHAQAAALLPAPSGADGFRIRIPSVGIDAAIVSVGLEADGSMAAPDGPDIVGWFAPGPRPGQRGNVLLDGHVDWTDRQTGIPRTAVFYPLKNVQPGHDIVIDADGRRHTYRVRETLLFAWDDPSALRVLQPTSDAVVTLITCEGAFDRSTRNYSHRRVVIAGLVSSE